MLTTGRSRIAIWTAAAMSMLAFGAFSAAGASGAVTVSQSGWAWGNPSPQGNTLHAVAFAGALGYAVGDNGTALKTLDGGATWSGLATGTAGQLTRVQIVDANTVVTGGSNGCIVRISTNGGVLFTRIFTVDESTCPDPVQSFNFVSAQIGYLLLHSGSVLVTHDGGASFSRLTGVPGTPASSGGGGNVGIDIHFTTATSGIAFVGPSGGGQSLEYKTSDGGVSWTPVTLPGANVSHLYFLDATHAFGIGPGTLITSTDGGGTWTAQPIGKGNSFNSINCTDAKTCVLTVAAGDHLVRTSDGGATASITTPSSAALFGAAYSTATRVVGVGSGGATVLSNDGGANFTTASSDIGGQYSRIRTGPAGLVYAAGANGVIALSRNAGVTWGTVATQTSASLLDVSFASTTTGYALDVNGGLQLTTNGGTSWKTLDPGTPAPASAVAALSSGAVLLAGPVGVFRSVSGGRFNVLTGKAVSRARVAVLDTVGTAVFAFGPRTLIVSTDGGTHWRSLHLPLTNKRGKSPIVILSVSFVSASSGFLLDGQGRVWRTTNGGRSWTELPSTGSSDGTSVAFADVHDGFMTLSSFGGDTSNAYLLRTSDGGATWHPQLIAAGRLGPGQVAVESASNAFALIEGPELAGKPDNRLLFFTNSGGDAGAASTLTISTKATRLAKRKLRRLLHNTISVDGVLAGAQGGEHIVVSRRNLAGGQWQHQTAIAGVNGGSFTTIWHVTGSSVFVAQWAGDSGRASVGTKVLRLTVR
jgi:photosystem II stability/assembly factor-like uncharacterized protein